MGGFGLARFRDGPIKGNVKYLSTTEQKTAEICRMKE